jgi:hypothetical protein
MKPNYKFYRILGYFIIASPFIAIFTTAALKDPIYFLKVIGGLIGIGLWMWLGVYFTNKKFFDGQRSNKHDKQ